MADRDALVGALAGRCDPEHAATQTGLAWYAGRHGHHRVALAAARAAVAAADPPAAAWTALEALTAGRTDRLVLPADSDTAASDPEPRIAVAAGVEAHRHDAWAVAELCYRAAVDDGRCRVAATANLMVLHEQRGEAASADRLWETVAASPGWHALHNRALTLARRGSIGAARRLLAGHRDLVVPRAELLFLVGYLALLDGDAAAGRVALQAALARDGALARALFALGIACDLLDRPGDAISAIRSALVSSPWFAPQVWLLALPDGEGCVEQPASVVEGGVDGPTDQILLALGRSLLFTGQQVEALAVFDQVLLRNPDHPVARYHRGVVLAKLRRYDEALGDWQRVRDALPGDAELATLAARNVALAGRLAELFAGSGR